MTTDLAIGSYVSVIAPLHDDADIVAEFVTELIAGLGQHSPNYELVLVDDGSQDDTVERVSALMKQHDRMRLIRLSRPFGQEIAISAGLDSVIGDFVVVMLPDSDPPALVPEMVDRARSGVEVVFGIRKSRKSDPLFLRLGSALFYWYCNRVLRLGLPKNSTHFRVLSRRVVNALIRIKDRGRYLRTLSQHVGYDSQAFSYDLVERRRPPRKKSLMEAAGLAVNIMTTNSRRPLRMMSWLSASFALANLGYLVYTIFVSIVDGGTGGGLPAASVQSSLSIVVLFTVLAVLCEYVGGVVDASKGRPLYYVMEERNSSVPILESEQRNIVSESTDR